MSKKLYTFHLQEEDLKRVIESLDFFYMHNFKTKRCQAYKSLADTLQSNYDRIQDNIRKYSH